MSAPCPSRQTLLELLLTPTAQTEAVSQHAAGCLRCQGELEELSSQSGGDRTRTAGSSASQADRAFLPRGTAIGHYVLLEPLGAGGMGSVYAAYDAKLDRRVALKLLHSDGQGAEHSARLEREARAMARISHPHVLSVYELGHEAGRRFITMELVDGWTLGDWLGLQRRGWREVLASFRAAGAGLEAAHAAGLVHRDFKPANVLVSNDGRVRVTDFGLVRLRTEPTEAPSAEPGPAASADPGALTVAGALLGTPRYMAPEQLTGDEVTPRSDQFSFCVALYEALYGSHPFGAQSLGTLLEAMRQGPPLRPPPGSRIPRAIHEALRRGLSHRPEDRWPELAPLLAQLARDPGPRRRRWMVGGAALLGLALVLGGAGLVRREDQAACARAAAEIDGAWSSPQREAVRRAFAPLTEAYAVDALPRTVQRLDEYREEWAGARLALCTAARQQSLAPERVRAQEDCLALRRRELAGFAGALVQADARIASRAVTGAHALTPVASCADPQALALLPVNGGEDPQRAQELAGQLVEAKAAHIATGGTSQLEQIRGLVKQAQGLRNRALEAEALGLAGTLLSHGGEPKEADRLFKEGILAATAGRHHAQLALLWTLLAQSKAVDQGSFEEGWEALTFAEAANEAIGNPKRARLNVLMIRALVLWMGRRIPDALAAAEEAVKLGEEVPGVERELFSLRTNYGALLLESSRPAEAAVQMELALEGSVAMVGPDHPSQIENRMNLSLIYASLPRRPDHLKDAEREARRALEVARQVYGEENLRVADPTMNLGSILAGAQRYAEAEPLLAAAISRYEANGISHRFYRNAILERAQTLARLGRHPEADAQLRKAEQVTSRLDGVDPLDRPTLEAAWGRVALAAGRWPEATRRLQAALSGHQQAGGDPLTLARLRFDWAQAVRHTTPRAGDQARRAAEEARATLEQEGYARESGEIAAWLAGAR